MPDKLNRSHTEKKDNAVDAEFWDLPDAPRKSRSRRQVRLSIIIPASVIVVLVALVLNQATRERSLLPLAVVDNEYSSLASEINALEVRQLIARGNDAKADVAGIDKQLAPLKAKLAELQPRHEQAVEERRLQQESEARRQEQQQIEAMQKKESELKKRCEDIKSKRVADLTVNDLELLKACGISVPHLPLE
jgi:septal ring factor EnvC (AmiA/AmiB activator)